MRDRLPFGIARAIGASMLFSVSAVIGVASLHAEATAAVQAARPRSQRKPSPRKIRITAPMTREAQQRLIELGYWIAAADGKWNEASRQGLIAFQKVEGRARTGKLSTSELQALRSARRPSPRERGAAHIEVDLKRQVLFIVDADGTVSKVLPVSSASGEFFTNEGVAEKAVTPVGRFRVYGKLVGWRKSDFGLLYYPNYIVGGIAIHGSPSVPAQPASHGCIRIPMFAAEEFSDMTPIGTQVIVFDGSTPASQSLAPRQ